MVFRENNWGPRNARRNDDISSFSFTSQSNHKCAYFILYSTWEASNCWPTVLMKNTSCNLIESFMLKNTYFVICKFSVLIGKKLHDLSHQLTNFIVIMCWVCVCMYAMNVCVYVCVYACITYLCRDERTYFLKTYRPLQNFRRLKGEIKQVTNWDTLKY
jgi:hypothetical protein